MLISAPHKGTRMHATLPRLIESDFPAIRRARLEVLQVNLGYRCNQACLHCHVNASPYRKEAMSRETAEHVAAFMRVRGVGTIDLTGGAPELNAQFEYLVDAAGSAGVHVIDRCNLTVLQEPGQEKLAEYLAGRRVHVIASLPCYMEENVDAQRGDGVFQRSIQGLRRLNELGYGDEQSELVLDLVYNPQGPQLPPPQEQLQIDYKKHLRERFGVRFNSLFTLANLPIQRFGSTLVSRGQFDVYMTLLKSAHQPGNVPAVMCRSLLSIDYQGYVYDCDFNQMLGVPLGGQRRHITDLLATELEGESIAVADHCYGCTAGQGSSCGGALSA